MFKKGSKLYSIFYLKCPRCHHGPLFKESNPYKLHKLGKMYSECKVCGESYNPEPGFYFGAAYVSYALNVALGVASIIALMVLTDIRETWTVAGILSAICIMLVPVTFVLSRSIWINLFVHYREGASSRRNQEIQNPL